MHGNGVTISYSVHSEGEEGRNSHALGAKPSGCANVERLLEDPIAIRIHWHESENPYERRVHSVFTGRGKGLPGDSVGRLDRRDPGHYGCVHQ